MGRLVTPPRLQDPALANLYSLKAGVVPANGVAEFTIGRGPALARVNRALEKVLQGRGAHIDFVEGAYGEGKSHLLGHARSAALERGCAVVSITADFNSVMLHRARPFMHATTSHLEVPDHPAVGLVPLLRNLIEQPEFCAQAHSLYARWRHAMHGSDEDRLAPWPSGFYAAAARPTLSEDVGRWLSGESIPIQPLRSRIGNVCAPPKRMGINGATLPGVILGLAGSLCLLGYGGLVLLIDEAENALGPTSTPTQRRKSAQLLAELATGRLPLYVLAAVTPSTSLILGSDIDRAPYPPSRLTPYGLKYVVSRLEESALIQLPPLSCHDLAALGGRIIEMHSHAFDWNAMDHVGRYLLGGSVEHFSDLHEPTRAFVRHVVAVLELCEQYRDVPADCLFGQTA